MPQIPLRFFETVSSPASQRRRTSRRCRLLCSRRPPRPAAAARAAAPVSDATAEAIEAADAAGARAPGAACVVDPVAAAGGNLDELPPDGHCGRVRRRPGGALSTRCASPITLCTHPASQHPDLLPSRARAHIAALADSCVCDVSGRKVAAALNIVRSTLHGTPVAPESNCDRAEALLRLAWSSSAGWHPPRALPLRAPPPRLSARAHCRSMRRNLPLTGPRARASQATGSVNDCAAAQRTRAAKGRWRAIGVLAPLTARHAAADRSVAPMWWRVGVGAAGGGWSGA